MVSAHASVRGYVFPQIRRLYIAITAELGSHALRRIAARNCIVGSILARILSSAAEKSTWIRGRLFTARLCQGKSGRAQNSNLVLRSSKKATLRSVMTEFPFCSKSRASFSQLSRFSGFGGAKGRGQGGTPSVRICMKLWGRARSGSLQAISKVDKLSTFMFTSLEGPVCCQGA